MWIYNGNRINHAFHRAASLSVSNCGMRNCTLTVGNIQMGDTGAFACVGGNVNKHWSITILRKYRQYTGKNIHMKQMNVLTANHFFFN